MKGTVQDSMKIYSSTQHSLNLYENLKKHTEKPDLVTGTVPGLWHAPDTVEISPAAKQLAASDIVNHSATYVGSAQIHDSLNRLLQDQPSAVKEAVYGIIQSNFITNVTGEEERAALLELGLTQAQYIADNYMKEDKAAEFMDTIRQIGAISKTGTVDPETKAVHYETPPQRPVGAPDDYINLGDMMRKFEPETLDKLEEAVMNGKDWNSILQSFAKKVAAREDWVKQYREETANRNEQLKESLGENRFANASTAGLTDFSNDIKGIISSIGLGNTGFLRDNLEAFIRTLGSTNKVK
ncbi:hypothetical protein [Paenibacillus jiagnxiensis]|uniref:hypothetical protein n=1 Tax=Paenibacillus jiagnxiensis TaxID=3228926 RepID=UPI003480C90E